MRYSLSMSDTELKQALIEVLLKAHDFINTTAPEATGLIEEIEAALRKAGKFV